MGGLNLKNVVIRRWGSYVQRDRENPNRGASAYSPSRASGGPACGLLSRQYQRGKMIEAYPGGPSVHGRLGCRGRSGIFAECMVSAL